MLARKPLVGTVAENVGKIMGLLRVVIGGLIACVLTCAGGAVWVNSTTEFARITRDDVIIYNGAISSLRRFKDDVPEVRAGLECGVTFESHTDIKAGDYLETFEVEERERTI